MTATSIPDPTARVLTEAQQATFEAGARDYHLGQLEIGPSLKHAFFHARQAREHGADPDEVLMRLEAWVAERGLL